MILMLLTLKKGEKSSRQIDRQYICIGFKRVFLPKAMAPVSVKPTTQGYIPLFFLSSPTFHLSISLFWHLLLIRKKRHCRSNITLPLYVMVVVLHLI